MLLIFPAGLAIFPAVFQALVEPYNPELRGPIHPAVVLVLAAIPAIAGLVAWLEPLFRTPR
jgi:hypothetical protein